jgi:hypothetical protein
MLAATKHLAAPPPLLPTLLLLLLLGDGSCIYPWFNCYIHSAPQVQWVVHSLSFGKNRLNLQNNKNLIAV